MRKVVFMCIILGCMLLIHYAHAGIVWVTRAPSPAPPRGQIQAHGNVRDTIYFCGGRTSSARSISTVHAYVPATNTWVTTLPSMPQPRSHGCGDVIDTVIYAVAGWDNSGPARGTLYAFNVNRKTWTTMAPLPESTILCTGAAYGGRLYVFGSQNNGDTLFEYNPANNTWRILYPTGRPAGRRLAAAAGTASFLYIMGGIDRTPTVLRDCWRFSRSGGDTWTRMADMPGPRCLHAAYAQIGDSVLYVIGGNGTGTGAANDSIVYKYTTATNTWTIETPMVTARGFLTLDRSGNKIYATFGINSSTFFTTNEEGTPGVAIEENRIQTNNIVFKINPNPIRDQTTIIYCLNIRSKVTLKIYNVSGELIKVLVDRIEEPGVKMVGLECRNLASGIYFINLTTDKVTRTDKLLIIR